MSVAEFIQEWCVWIVGPVSLKLTERLISKSGEKGKRAYRINRKPRCRFKLSPIKCHQLFLRNGGDCCRGEFSNAFAVLQSKEGGDKRTVFVCCACPFSSFSLRIHAQGND